MTLLFQVGNTIYRNIPLDDFLQLNISDEEKISAAKKALLDLLKQNYASAATRTDARILQYNKRKELGILDEDNEADYQEALDYYKKITEQYRQKKAQLEQISDIEQLQSFDTSIG